MAVVSMVLGIVGMVGAIWLYGAIVGLVAMFIGEVERRAILKDPEHLAGRGFAQTGADYGGVQFGFGDGGGGADA